VVRVSVETSQLVDELERHDLACEHRLA
jgi:hypothetical protein